MGPRVINDPATSGAFALPTTCQFAMVTPVPRNMPFKILALDGGGVRGIYSAHVLRRLCESFDLTPSRTFDLIVGTSTGSIIAAAPATDYDLADVCEKYETSAPQIFTSSLLPNKGIFGSKYSQRPLKDLLESVFHSKTLGQVTNRLVIPATDISNGNVYVFKSSYDPSFVRDRATPVATAVLASCAAPLFFDPVSVGTYLVADGGMWANNPSVVALTEGLSRLKQKLDDIRILSIGIQSALGPGGVQALSEELPSLGAVR